MSIVRSYTNGFEVTDWTQEVLVVPNQWGFFNQLGLFESEAVTQHTATFEEITLNGAVLVDYVRGSRASAGQEGGRKIHTFAIPHFPHDDYITPQDIQGKSAYNGMTATGGTVDTKEAVRARKLARIRQNHAWTLEVARAQLITAGTVYAPNNTVALNWNTEFGVSRTSVDFLLGTSTTDIIAKIEVGIAAIQDNTGGANVTGTMVLCSPEFFGKLIAHPSVKAAYTYFKQAVNPLNTRLADGFSMGARRHFEFGGTLFVELRDTIGGYGRLIPAQAAYMIPLGTEGVFKTFFSPAHKFDFVNTPGEELYVFETADPEGEKDKLASETNFVNGIMRPILIVNFTTSN